MTAHSPGPWHDDGLFPGTLYDVEGDAVATGIETDANARLIAAAAELAALAHNVAQDWCSVRRLSGQPCDYERCWPCRALALLRRIEGESGSPQT